MILQITIIILILLLIALLLLLFHIGVFKKIQIVTKTTGPYVLIYEDHIGDYKYSPGIQNRIYETLLNSHNIRTYRGFGIYYDNPKQIPAEELRSKVGCILEEPDYNKISMLKEIGFNVLALPAQKSITAEFPFNNSLSVLAGIIKVYPAMHKFISDHNLAQCEMMEIYDIPNRKILYSMKIS